ncbi:MAG: hypothetical protein HYY06_18365 [Deltaproteobacteria bacterium]|nr:hypothetical protein [Deltaproteobacteria bacterium]
MTCEDLENAFHFALRQSGLPVIGFETETLDLRSMSRTFRVRVEPSQTMRTSGFKVATRAAFFRNPPTRQFHVTNLMGEAYTCTNARRRVSLT